MDQVKVLQHHIDRGRRGCPTHCAVALALIDHFPGADLVEVDGSDLRVYWPGNNTALYAPSPDSVYRFIRHFDEPDGTPSQPFEFNVTFVPEQPINPEVHE